MAPPGRLSPGLTGTGTTLKKRRQVTVEVKDGKDQYSINGTAVANEEWRPNPGTDDVKRIDPKSRRPPAGK